MMILKVGIFVLCCFRCDGIILNEDLLTRSMPYIMLFVLFVCVCSLQGTGFFPTFGGRGSVPIDGGNFLRE